MNNMPFKDYEGFKEIFAVKVNPNGEQYRQNKILLSYYKTRELRNYIREVAEENPDVAKLLEIKDMQGLFDLWNAIVMNQSRKMWSNRINIMGEEYGSEKYKTDGQDGICLDGDIRAYRYVNTERDRVFKMKMGKLYKSLILGTPGGSLLPEQVVLWMCEEMARKWEVYSSSKMPTNRYTLVVDDNFAKIYNEYGDCITDFGSCMSRKSRHSFYTNCVTAKAAYLEDEDGRVAARCVVFTEVHEEGSDKMWRLAERQYSLGSNEGEMLKRLLIQKLIDGNHIDGYKRVGAGCSDMSAFVTNSGESLSDKVFWIKCDINPYNSIMSYQDSFKAFDEINQVIYNSWDKRYDCALDTTDQYLDTPERVYDDYHERYIDEEDAVDAIYRGDRISVDSNDLGNFTWCEQWDVYCYVEECVYCEDTEDTPESYGVHYSEILEEYWHDMDEMKDAELEYKKKHWFLDEWNDEYVENESDLAIIADVNDNKSYTISNDSLMRLLAEGYAYEFDGVYYSLWGLIGKYHLNDLGFETMAADLVGA